MSLPSVVHIRYFSFLAALLLFSCSRSKYVELPSMLENQLPSLDKEMQFNIGPEKKELPDKIKRIYQIQGKDTINILEYDKDKNLIFKYYKQFEGDYWHDKFLFMIEANVYENNKLVKTYYLHSNVGYELFLYDYDGDNISNIKSYHLDNIKGVNINQYSFIKKIKDYKRGIDFAEHLNIRDEGKFDYEINRDFNVREVKEYGNDASSYKLFKLNDRNQIEEIQYYADGKKWKNDSKFYKYDSQGRLAIAYSIGQKDTIKYSKYQYDGANTIITKREFGVGTSTKTYSKNRLVEWNYLNEQNSSLQREFYTLDNHGIPVKVLKTDDGKAMEDTFKNYYEFYN